MDANKILYPFGAADSITVDASVASHDITVENRKTLLSLAPTQDTTINFTADEELPVGSEVELLVDTGGTAFTLTIGGASVANSVTLAEQTVNGFANVCYVFDGTNFREKSRAVTA